MWEHCLKFKTQNCVDDMKKFAPPPPSSAKKPVKAAKAAKRERSRPKKKKSGEVKKKPRKNSALVALSNVGKTPLWTRHPVEMHPGLAVQLAKPFLSTIYIDKESGGFCFPLNNGDPPHRAGGLHARMKTRFFHKTDVPPREYKKGAMPRRKGSSKTDGSKADRDLEKAIRQGSSAGLTSPYAIAIWKYWQRIDHIPVLAQLPVYIVRANVATAGDYFTINRADGTLWLWELKTGWPKQVPPQKCGLMDTEPLSAVWCSSENRWQVQLMLTQMAYEKELGLKITGQARVIHTWMERPEGDAQGIYTAHVRVLEPEKLEPSDWPKWIDRDALYAAL